MNCADLKKYPTHTAAGGQGLYKTSNVWPCADCHKWHLTQEMPLIDSTTDPWQFRAQPPK